MQIEKEAIQIINKQLDTNFAESISMVDLQQELSVYINHLIETDFEKLLNILYKVDVDENKLKQLRKLEAGKDAGVIITGLIIERELQKLNSRKKYGKNK